VVYLNSDYVGGEIVFPHLDLTDKPATGQALIFPSEYLHAVLPVQQGVKYSAVGFFLAPE
jgi:predicted 2-oxoglutarate/Fe(II)-dependent dioxygenase YbiX